MGEVRIALTEEDFRHLVASRVAYPTQVRGMRSTDVEIILSDIGWDRMQAAIDDAKGGRDG